LVVLFASGCPVRAETNLAGVVLEHVHDVHSGEEGKTGAKGCQDDRLHAH